MRYVLPVITLVMGITLSGVAAYYSVYGLTALFSAAAVAVLILGGALEAAKLTLASVLHAHWSRLTGWMKVLFPIQLLVLILITGIGIYGFLTSAYIGQKAETGGPQSRISGIERQIASQKGKITVLETERTTLDKTLTVLASNAKDGITESASRGSKVFAKALDTTAEATAKTRSLMAKDYDRINAEIAAALALIERLELEKLPLEKEIRAIETKIGPLKYVAQTLYGADDAATTDKAVRTLILLMMFVFDPLAISLVVIGGHTLAHAHRYRHAGTRTRVTKAKEPTVAKPLPPSNVTSFEDAKAERTRRQKTGSGGIAAALKKPQLNNRPPMRQVA